jgi:hypothetical protein
MGEPSSIVPFLPVLGSLLGALVGGLISTLTALAIERQRRRRERLDKFADLKREALAAALEWIEPMRNAHIRASSLALATVHGNADQGAVHGGWPKLTDELSKADLTGVQRAVLPEGTYTRGHHIASALNDLRNFALKESQSKHIVDRKPLAGLKECQERTDAIDQAIQSLEHDLRGELRRSFD